jgi:Flp pilus assembly protein TadD
MKPLARAAFLRQYATVLTGKADDEAAADVFEEAMRLAPLDYDSGLAYGYSLIQLGRLEEANKEINALRMRFGERTRLRMLDRVLQNQVQELRQETQR